MCEPYKDVSTGTCTLLGWKIKCNFIKSIKSNIESHFTVREEIKGCEPTSFNWSRRFKRRGGQWLQGSRGSKTSEPSSVKTERIRYPPFESKSYRANQVFKTLFKATQWMPHLWVIYNTGNKIVKESQTNEEYLYRRQVYFKPSPLHNPTHTNTRIHIFFVLPRIPCDFIPLRQTEPH